MTDDELKAIDQRLAAMSERVEAVIAKESRGKPMPVLKPRPKAKSVPARPIDALQDERFWHEDYSQRAPTVYDGSIEQIFADFERQFDEMAQAHRFRA